MPTKKTPVLEEIEEEEYTPTEMAEALAASLTVAVPDKKEEVKEPRVRVMLPKLIGDEDGLTVDQYEHVTIANERGEICYKVLRGEYVDVPISVFMVLKQKYPKL